ncbi:CopK family periplasmic copper-binding protein [Polaromonas sp. DSR2-3-2]|uniref:CopK family periplasmic copper-binding protein n=1 Tax=unclassified Polaromonas TaxID=2638319 RepID=UPI003CF37A00
MKSLLVVDCIEYIKIVMFRSGRCLTPYSTLPSVMQRLASQPWSISLGLLQSARKDFYHVYCQNRRWVWSHFSGLSAFAVDQAGIEKSVELKDGSTVHLFKDGKMARWQWKINSGALSYARRGDDANQGWQIDRHER